MDKAGTTDAVMIGDTSRDCEAAARAGIPTRRGAVAVFESLPELQRRLDETPLSSA